jgi:hypothetical protein
VDHNLHVSQALNHIDRILAYYPMVQEGNEASVWLTFEDWQVLYDLLFRTENVEGSLPEKITAFGMQEGEAVILLNTEDCRIRVEMTG